MVREVITVSIGKCGIYFGNSIWIQYFNEHNVNKHGNIPNDSDTSFACFFHEIKSKKYITRNLSIDLDPNTINDIKTSEYCELFSNEYLVNHFEDAGNIFARGYYTVGIQIMYEFNNQLRKLVETCHNVQGFLFNHSVGGGTGSGLGAKILSNVAVDYRKKASIGNNVYGFTDESTNVVEPYNAMLATQSLIEYNDVSYIFDNDAIYELCQNKLNIKKPTYDNMNKLMAKTASGITSNLRFEGELNVDLNDFRLPFPRLHFMIQSLAPVRPPTIHKIPNMDDDVLTISEQAFDYTNFFVKLPDLLS